MAKGFEAIKQAADKIDSASSSFSNVLFFNLRDDGDSAVVRFLEQGDDVYSYWYHDFSHVDEANGWRTKVPCLDQEMNGEPCPGCDNGMPRRFQGLINVIWRNAPVFKRDDDNKVVINKTTKEYEIEGHEDQIAVWRAGITLFSKNLARKDVTYKGLSSREFEVTREGRRRDPKTTYSIEPADIDAGATKLSKTDQALANDKYDLEDVAGFVDEATFNKIIHNRLNGSNDDDTDISEFLSKEPFSKE